MENKGKRICDYLKEVRRRVADENNIPLEQHECTYKDECSGTCPRCEAELKRRSQLGKVAVVAGLAVATAAFASCTEGDVVDPNAQLMGAYDFPVDTTVVDTSATIPQDTINPIE